MFALHYREFWSGVSAWLVNELDQMAASAQTRWAKQHTTNGEHTNITAESVTAVTVTGDTLVGPLVAPLSTDADHGVTFADTGVGLYTSSSGHLGVSMSDTTVMQAIEKGTAGAAARTLYLVDGNFGAGAVPGPRVIVGRNGSGGGAAACLSLQERGGSAYYLWVEDGKLRIGLNPPTESDSVPHAGTVVGTQT